MIDPLDVLIRSPEVIRDPERFARLNRIRLFRQEVPVRMPVDPINYPLLLKRRKQFLDDISAERGEGPLAVVPGRNIRSPWLRGSLEGLRSAADLR